MGKPLDAGEIAVPPRTPLDVIAKASGVSTSVIRKLNPDVLGKELPPGKGEFLVSVPPESVSRAVAALPTMLELSNSRVDHDDVVDPLDLMSPEGYRPLGDEDGSLLSLLPKPKKKRTRSFRDPLSEDFDARLDSVALSGDEFAPKKKKDTVLYRVGEGDTLNDIAKQFAQRPSDIARDNGLDAGEKPKAGTFLKLNIKKDLLEDLSKGKQEDAEAEKPKGKRPSKG